MRARYRRPRTRLERYDMVDTIVRNFPRFFPKGVPPLFFHEWDARHERGRRGFEPSRRTHGVMYGNQSSRPRRLFTSCWGCRRVMNYDSRQYPAQPPRFCSSRCRVAARLAATYTVFPDWTHLDTVTTELRLWCYTHDTLNRHPSEIVDHVLTNLEPLLMTTPATQTLNQYFDERVALTTEQQDQLRLRIGNLIARHLPRASANLAGTSKKPWDNNQVRLFLGLLNKLVPDMTASMSLALTKNLDSPPVDPSTMTSAELEAYIATELAKRAPKSPILPEKATFEYEINPVAPTPNKGHKNLRALNERRKAEKAARLAAAAAAASDITDIDPE